MKILLITENLGSGGAERQLVGLAVLLKKRGYKVKVISYVNNQFYLPLLNYNQVDYELYSKARSKYTRVYYLNKLFKREKPDAVISFLPSVNLSVCLTRLFVKYRLIVSERSHTQKFNLRKNIELFSYLMADKLVANSFSESDNIKEHFPLLRNRIIAIPNFVDTDKFVPFKRVPKDIPLILSVGRLIPSKNALRLLDALKIIYDKGFRFSLRWIGNQSNKEYLKQVIDKIDKLHLNDFVTLVEQKENVLLEYQHADIFCFPTLFEGFPNVLCEAMSCELPIVSSNVCDIPQVVDNHVNGFLFDPTNIDYMVNALENMLNMKPEQFSCMGKLNRRKMIDNYSKEEFVEQYIKLLE